MIITTFNVSPYVLNTLMQLASKHCGNKLKFETLNTYIYGFSFYVKDQLVLVTFNPISLNYEVSINDIHCTLPDIFKVDEFIAKHCK